MLVCYLMENIVLSYVVFFFLVLVWAGAILPFVRRWSDTLDVPQPTGVLSVCLGIGLGLLSFSIVARFFTNYALAFPLSVLAVWALGFLAQKNLFQSETKPKEFWNKPNKAFTAFFLILFFALIAWRFYFPNVEVISENMGGEKLYNFQYQQAFVFGHGYPPEHLWYLGSKINYYILPKALPGLTSHFMASLFNLPMTGGVTFVLGDVFFIALGCAAVGAFAFTAMSLISSAESKLRLPMSVVLASFPMLVAPARAFSQVFNGNIDFWSLSRIIPDTINEYPLWNFAFADNHAHSNAIFLQVSFWAVFTALLIYKGARNSVFSVLSGLLLGALLYSNTHSVMISAALFAPVTLYLLFKDCWQTANYSLLKYLLEFVFVFGAATWPVQTGDRPDTMLYLVPSEMTSTVMDFLNVQFIIFAALVFLFACLQKTTPIFSTQEIKSRKELKVLAAIAIVSAVLGYPVVGLCLIVAAVLLSSGHEKNTMTVSLAASGTLMLWIVPEIVGMNLDYGNEFMRVNTVFKFYFEAIYAVPLFLILAFWKQFDTQALATLLKKLRPVMVLCVLLIIFVQWKSAWARIHKSADEPSLDGMVLMVFQNYQRMM